jgi:hypothetical protein
MAPKLPDSWWNLVLDGKLRHIPVTVNSPYRSTASLRSAIYREAGNRGLTVATHLDVMAGLVYVQAWTWRLGSPHPAPIRGREEESTPAPDPLDHWSRPMGKSPGAVIERIFMDDALGQHARVPAVTSVASEEDIDLIQEREHCTCGLGNANGGQVHEPSCKAWG